MKAGKFVLVSAVILAWISTVTTGYIANIPPGRAIPHFFAGMTP